MFLRIIYDAKIGKGRQIRETYTNAETNGDMRLLFDRDIDWSQPVFMVLVPTDVDDSPDKINCDSEFGETPLDKRTD